MPAFDINLQLDTTELRAAQEAVRESLRRWIEDYQVEVNRQLVESMRAAPPLHTLRDDSILYQGRWPDREEPENTSSEPPEASPATEVWCCIRLCDPIENVRQGAYLIGKGGARDLMEILEEGTSADAKRWIKDGTGFPIRKSRLEVV